MHIYIHRYMYIYMYTHIDRHVHMDIHGYLGVGFKLGSRGYLDLWPIISSRFEVLAPRCGVRSRGKNTSTPDPVSFSELHVARAIAKKTFLSTRRIGVLNQDNQGPSKGFPMGLQCGPLIWTPRHTNSVPYTK